MSRTYTTTRSKTRNIETLQKLALQDPIVHRALQMWRAKQFTSYADLATYLVVMLTQNKANLEQQLIECMSAQSPPLYLKSDTINLTDLLYDGTRLTRLTRLPPRGEC